MLEVNIVKFPTGQGMNRDPNYQGPRGLGFLGLSTDIINWPQTIAQWWGAAFFLMLFALPWGIWGALLDEDRYGGFWLLGTYLVMAGLFLLMSWVLRNEKSEDFPQLLTSIIVGIISLPGVLWLSLFRTFSDGQWFAGLVVVFIFLVLLNQIFRSWQLMLIIGLFTEQPRLLEPPPEYQDQVSKYKRQKS